MARESSKQKELLVDTHVHTRYSDGIAGIPRIERHCQNRGWGVAVTDHNEIRGAAELYERERVPVIPGIEVGTPIRKSGVRIGQVSAVELDPDSGQVRVRIAVNRKYLPRRSEEAHITRGLLSGDTAHFFGCADDLKIERDVRVLGDVCVDVVGLLNIEHHRQID